MPMRSQTKKNERPLIDDPAISESANNWGEGDIELNNVVQKISIEHVSLEKRREEAKKPLYLVRYE